VIEPARLPNYPIDDLISSRCNELDIGPVEFVRRCEISRRYFLGLSASLPLLVVVGPHMLLSEKPTWFGWTSTDYVPPPYASFSWMTVGERVLSDRHYEQEVLRRRRLEQLWAIREKEVQARRFPWAKGK
jgi:hypothetical protein